MGAIGSIFGGMSASKAMKNVKNNIESQRKENKSWYDRRYNEDATQRNDAQAILSRTEASIRERNRQAAGAAAVGGASDESVALAKESGNKALAEATAHIAEAGERRKDAIEGEYRSKDEALQGELNDLEKQRAHAVSQAIGGVTQAGANIAGLF